MPYLVSDDPANQSVSRHAFELMHFLIDKRLSLGRLTVADATSLTGESRRALRHLAKKHRFNTAAVVFDVTVETCLRRNSLRQRLVPDAAVSDQHGMLTRAMQHITQEGFDRLYILRECDLETAKVEILRRRRVSRDC